MHQQAKERNPRRNYAICLAQASPLGIFSVTAVTNVNDTRQALQPTLLCKAEEINPQQALLTTPRVVRCMAPL